MIDIKHSTKPKRFCFYRPVQSVIIVAMSGDSINLKLEKREVLGKAVKHLRRDGFVPAVIHDHGKPSLHVQGDKVAMQNFVALIRDAEFDPKKHQLRHLVFNAVDKDQKVEAEIPVRPHYDEGNESSPAERNSLIVLSQLETVQVKAIPTQLPDFFEYDAEKLVEVGDHVTVADLSIPQGVEMITEPEHAIATVYEPSALQAANDDAGGDAEPEDAEEVEAEHEGETEEGTQAAESMPGGKEQKEPKPSSVEAAKEDKNEEKASE
jgi:large subunit ribosomal protein L25